MFLKKLKYLFVTLIAAVLFTSCSDYQKLLKSTDYNLKYDKAIEYYNEKDYFRAHSLLEELMSIYKASDKYEEIYYYYAYCFFGEGDYILAGYYFKNYTITYPVGKHKEECLYMSAYCYYLDSPESSLDQANTIKAIDEFQLFINRYPNSERIPKCNEYIDKLRGKLETKSFENAKLYYNLGEYKAAIQALSGSLKDYPDSDYREEILYLILKSNFLLAQNSVLNKKNERYQATLKEFYVLTTEFPETKYLKEASKIYDYSKKVLEIN